MTHTPNIMGGPPGEKLTEQVQVTEAFPEKTPAAAIRNVMGEIPMPVAKARTPVTRVSFHPSFC